MPIVHQDFPAGVIITGGFGADGCNGFVITTQFSLYPLLPLGGTVGVSGGSRPLRPGEIQNFYKPVVNKYNRDLTPQQLQDFFNKRHVTVKVKFKDKTFTKEYLVPVKRARAIVGVINLLNRTKDRIVVTARNMKNVATRAVVKILNLHRKD